MKELMIVDDEQVLLEGLELLLSDLGYTVQTATSGEAALTFLCTSENYVPDLIITDMVMPGMNGVQLLNSLRLRTEYMHIPVLFMSARSSGEIEASFGALANARFLRKPFSIEALCETIDRMLDTDDTV